MCFVLSIYFHSIKLGKEIIAMVMGQDVTK